MNAIETQGLTKDYGNIVAVKDLNLNVREGIVYGFLGPNGAGKSTTINMLMGFMRPTSGTAAVMGYDIKAQHYEISKVTGYLPERPAFYDDLSAMDNFEYFGKLLGVEDVKAKESELLKKVGLEGRGGDRVRTYSHGMRQRLGIAIALLGEPKLLILDEPTTGLDPQGSHDIRQIIRELKSEKVTIFLSSHILHEVQEISDMVGIVKGGRLVVEKPIESFLRSMDENLPTIEVCSPAFTEAQIRIVEKLDGVSGVARADGKMIVTVKEPAIAEEINIALVGAGCRVRSIKEIMPTLEDAFLKVTADGNVEA
jgi:ABC-2 type transport system ATP-binding protein